jgi:acyl dehydratase
MTYTFPVEYGHILTFARAVGDLNPHYTDPDFAAASEFGEVIAPPTFAVAGAQFDPDYRLRPRPGQPWMGSARTVTGTAGGPSGPRVLHGEQHFEYHQPVRVGQRLTAETRDGEVTRKRGRSGLMTFRELITDYRDEQGDLVVTARAVRVEFEEEQ